MLARIHDKDVGAENQEQRRYPYPLLTPPEMRSEEMRCPKSTLNGRYGEELPDLIAFVCKTGIFFFFAAWHVGTCPLCAASVVLQKAHRLESCIS